MPALQMKEPRFAKLVLLVNGLVPLVLLLWDVSRNQAGANPLEFATRTTGMLTLGFLLLALAVSPLRRITGLNWLIKFRRMLGLFAFFYGSLHLLTYIAFDRFFRFSTIPGDIAGRRFIAVGMLAFVLMLPLAITSTNAMVKRLGARRWQLLHRLVYAIATLGVLHFWWLVKKDITEPVIFGGLLVLLFLARLIYVARKASTPARPAASSQTA